MKKGKRSGLPGRAFSETNSKFKTEKERENGRETRARGAVGVRR